jgi:hypothetical protein
MEPLLCPTDPFLGLSKALIAALPEIPVLGHLCIPQVKAHSLIQGCCPREVAYNLKGMLFRSISVGQGEQRSMDGQKIENGGVTELIRKLPKPWRCSLIEAEPKLSRTLIWLT